VEPTRQEFLHISQTEKYLFYALIYFSLALMAWQIWGRAKVWMQGKPIWWGTKQAIVPEGEQPTKPKLALPGFKDVGRWAGNIWTFVILQRKVKSSRKRSGAPMHLFIFYGFLSLFIATTILAINTYGPYNFHRGAFYLGYEFIFDLLGLLFVVGIGWAFFRRASWKAAGEALVAKLKGETPPESPMTHQFVDIRRNPLSHNLNDFLTLALLFTIGVTGYLLEAARIAVNPQTWDTASFVGYGLSYLMPGLGVWGYKSIWWFHMILVAVFFATIPRMKIRHIVMAMMSSAGRPEQHMGALVPISMEEVEKTEKIGVSHAKDYSRWHLMSLDACMECGRCTEVCPAWNVGKVLNPKQVVQDLRDAMVSGAEVAATVSEEALWQCTTCNACVEACPVLIRHVDMIVDARRNLVAEGRFSGTGAVMLRQVGSQKNAWGAPASSREDWMKDLEVPLCRDGVEFEFLFWVGCAGATDPGAVKTTKAFAQLLQKAGVSFACLGKEEACTGDPARRTGDEFLFQERAMENASVFQRYNVKKVVTACPHCFNTLKNEYGQFEAEMEVWHHSQLLAKLVDDGKLKPAEPARGEVVFHDPCYLARVNNESDAPRATLGEKTQLNEFPPDHFGIATGDDGLLKEAKQFGKKTLCCGAGGGRMWMEEPINQRPGNRRAEQLLATGAKTVAVGCPFCRIMLDASIKQVTNDEIRLIDLAELMHENNGGSTSIKTPDLQQEGEGTLA
jgi:Fe-S oxidoreductase